MKIIHVAQFLGIGGLEKIIFHLALEQQKRGHDVSIYIYDYERTWVEYFRNSGLIVLTPELKKSGYDFKLLQRMNHDLFNADVVHCHDLNPLMYVGPLTLWRKLTLQKAPRLIHTTHGLDHISVYPRAKLFQFIFSRMANKMIGVSEKIGDFYINVIKLKPSKVTVITNGIATFDKLITSETREKQKSWLAQRHNLDVSRPIALSLSRVLPLKDQLFLINAFKKRSSLQLVVVGPSSDDTYYTELKKLEDQNIKLVGAQELVTEYNLGCDLYVSASTHEGIPVAVLEAMAVETPCLISDIPGHKTLQTYGDFQNIFKLGDEEDFLNKLDFIFSHYDENKEIAKASRKLVEDHYSVKAMVNKYLKVYEE